jgi:hypothetical protein
MALGEEGHSGKALFPECNTRGREALADENWYLTAEVDGATLKTLFPEWHPLALGEESLFPECLIAWVRIWSLNQAKKVSYPDGRLWT